MACDCRWPQFWEFTVHAGIARKKTCKAEWNQLWVRALNVKWRISEFLFALDSNVVNTEVRPNAESSSGIFWKSLLKLGSKAKYEQGLTVTCCSEVHTHLSSPILCIWYEACRPPYCLCARATGRMIDVSHGSCCCKLLGKGNQWIVLGELVWDKRSFKAWFRSYRLLSPFNGWRNQDTDDMNGLWLHMEQE